MTRRVFEMLNLGWQVNEQCNDPVTWHRREYNQIADYLVNYTIDLGADWHHVFPSPEETFSEWGGNILCHSDGGTRAGSCLGTAWYAEVLVTNGNHMVRV